MAFFSMACHLRVSFMVICKSQDLRGLDQEITKLLRVLSVYFWKVVYYAFRNVPYLVLKGQKDYERINFANLLTFTEIHLIQQLILIYCPLIQLKFANFSQKSP